MKWQLIAFTMYCGVRSSTGCAGRPGITLREAQSPQCCRTKCFSAFPRDLLLEHFIPFIHSSLTLCLSLDLPKLQATYSLWMGLAQEDVGLGKREVLVWFLAIRVSVGCTLDTWRYLNWPYSWGHSIEIERNTLFSRRNLLRWPWKLGIRIDSGLYD
jgi:hypothetical protein